MSAAQRLDEVFGLPEGSEVYVLNDFKSSAYDAVRFFETLGLNQFRYIPFYPGAKDDGFARPLITFGEYDDQCHYLPRCIEKIIDVGIRTIDISTIVEIMLRLGLPDEKKHQVTAKYVKDLIALTREINHLNHNNESMRREMETVVQTVDEGIITLDACNNVLVFNAAAEKIFNLSSSDIVGRKISSLPSRLIEFLSYADINTAGGSGLYDYYGKRLAISLSEVRLNEEHAEKVYMIREATAIQKLNMDVQAASDRLATIESGDILVTAATATEPIIHGAEIKKGVYVAHLGDNEVDEELILRADKVVIDDWKTDKHRMGDTMAYMFRDGKIDDSRIDASVSDLMAGRKSGRDNDDQLTYTCNVGLGLYDVAIAARVYQYAKENGIGQKLKLWDEPIMV